MTTARAGRAGYYGMICMGSSTRDAGDSAEPATTGAGGGHTGRSVYVYVRAGGESERAVTDGTTPVTGGTRALVAEELAGRGRKDLYIFPRLLSLLDSSPLSIYLFLSVLLTTTHLPTPLPLHLPLGTREHSVFVCRESFPPSSSRETPLPLAPIDAAFLPPTNSQLVY